MQAAQHRQRLPRVRAGRRVSLLRHAPVTAVRLFILGGLSLLGVACTSVSPTQPDERSAQPPSTIETEVPAQAPEPATTGLPDRVAPPTDAAQPPRPLAPNLGSPPPPRELRMSAVGDIMLGGSAAPELAKYGYEYPFAEVRGVFQGSQLVFGNLEGPLTDAGRPAPGKRFVFRSPPERVASALKAAGFNIVALANNHTMDYGVEGLRQTRAALQAAGIQFVGAGENLREAREPAFMNAGGHSVAFLAYSLVFPESFWARTDNAGSAFGHIDQIRADVTAASQRADVVVVSFHWGREITTELRPYQTRLARAAIDAGARVVLGHHPHILQGIERYKGGIIFYSLGNFAFGSYSRSATRSIIAQLKIRDTQLTEVKLIPINVNNIEVVFQPRLLYAGDADDVIEGLRQLSESLGTVIGNRDGIGIVALDEDKEEQLLSTTSD